MKHEFTQKVFYADTDAYRVVWHGSYLRWLERGRCELADRLGNSIVELEEQNIVLPVIKMNISYKHSAKLYDELKIITTVKEFSKTTATFHQEIKCGEKLCLEADVVIVAVDKSGKLYRRLPEVLSKAFGKALNG